MAKQAMLFIGILTTGIIVRARAQLLDDANKNEHQDDVSDSDEAIDRAGYGASSPTTRVKTRPFYGSIALTECYVCTDCPNIELNSTFKQCPYAGDSSRNKCIVYTEQYRHMARPWYIRGCVSERGSCADVRAAHDSHDDIVKLLSCRECEGDRCNGVSRSIPTVTAFLVLVVTPLIAKHTLS